MQIAILHWYPANLTTSFAVGQDARGVTFDGANIWVTNNTSQTVTKLRASDGALLGTFGGLDAGPLGMVYDGANIWIVCSNVVDKLRASDGAVIGRFNIPRLSSTSLAFD